MRVTTLSRADLRERDVRLDPAYYVGRERVRSTVNAERSRTVRLADIIETVQDGARLPVVTAGVPIVRLSNIGPCELSLASMSHADGSAGNWVGVRAGDVLLTRAAEPFRAAAVPSGVPSKLAASSEISIIRPQPAVRPEYLAAVLCTPTLNRLLCDVAYRGRVAALPRFRLSDIGQLPVPLPTRSLQDSLARQYQQTVRLTAEARAEITTVATAIHAEIDHRVPDLTTPSRAIETRRSSLPERWDVPFNRGRQFRESLRSSSVMRPLLRLATPGTSSLRGLRDEDEVFAIQADDVNDATFLVEGGGHRLLTELSSRMRLRVDIGDVLMCTTGSGNQIAYVDEGIDAGRQAYPRQRHVHDPFGSTRRPGSSPSPSRIPWSANSSGCSPPDPSSASSTKAILTTCWFRCSGRFGAKTSRIDWREPCSVDAKRCRFEVRSSTPRTNTCGRHCLERCGASLRFSRRMRPPRAA